ncbi:hypothetical protein BDZ94DRAFT_1253974 [Collybia nuda]|uniref:Uncharacterized protein n=1 Tax=Collybia nuda TaxID=64659 RepID=A0A9P5YB77_9AGAR|nr:hypothetical protein BDZ94DRAFT_1253974 [Collybia nuda]
MAVMERYIDDEQDTISNRNLKISVNISICDTLSQVLFSMAQMWKKIMMFLKVQALLSNWLLFLSGLYTTIGAQAMRPS